jgi:hypothetical protein
MDFRFSNLKGWLIVAGTAVTAVSFAQAQSLMRPGQSIIFSAPDDGDAVPNAPSLAAQPTATPGFDNRIHAPNLDFQTPLTTRVRMPAPPQATVSAAEADRRANWALMTPAEILGVTTPEQEMKIQKRDAAGQPENLTAVERFYERQNQPQTNGAAGFLPATPSLHGDFRNNESGWLNANSLDAARGGFGNQQQSQATDSFQQPAPGNGAVASHDWDGGWSKTFISAETKSAQSPAQAENMVEFQKLLEPSQPSKSSDASSGDGLFSALQKSAFDQPANPSRSPGQFNNGVGVLPALPGVAGQSPAPTVPTAPDWKPQLPPWMLKGPQPGVIPQRVVF